MTWGLTQRESVLGCALLLAVGFTAISLLRGISEPRYQGKTVTEWLDCTIIEDDPLSSEYVLSDSALAAIGRIGTNALPILLEHLTWEPPDPPRWIGWWSSFRRNLGLFGFKVRNIEFRRSPKSLRLVAHRLAAASVALVSLGPDHQGVVAGLFDALDAQSQGFHQPLVCRALRSWNHDKWSLTSELIPYLSDPRQRVRQLAQSIMTGLGPQPKAVPGLTEIVLQAQEPESRYLAVLALGAVGAGDPATVTLLAGLLTNSPDANLRSAAARSLADSGKVGVSAIRALEIAANDTNRFVAKRAMTSLEKLRRNYAVPIEEMR